MKSGKVLHCMFLLAMFGGLTMHKTWQNTKGGYV